MGATAALSMVTTLANQDTAMHSDQHVLRADRCYAHIIGPRLTILGGLGSLTTGTQLWFRDGRFLFTSSPVTKE